ncbi:chaperonin 10-like protein [Aspergillus desertorum]
MPGRTMRAVRPIPQIQHPEDIIIKATYTALCGSDLHVYRGIESAGTGFVMGHEVTGEVVGVGDAVKTVKKGDVVVSAFTTSCGTCFYCTKGFSSRCDKNTLLGCNDLDGAQAEYVRIPTQTAQSLSPQAASPPTAQFAAQTVVIVGCGPVGLCALINALEYKPKHVLAVDCVPSRLELARSLGAEPWNFKTDCEALDRRVSDPALRMGFEFLRPCGVISSVGVHNGEIPWTGSEVYGKNVTRKMGRCPVRSVSDAALEVLKRNQHLLGYAHYVLSRSSVEAYDLFNAMKVQKVIFQAAK